MNDALHDIPTFSEFQQKERETMRTYRFALLAMTLYTSIKITGLVCATLIILQSPRNWPSLGIGGILFLATLIARFEFNPQSKKGAQKHVNNTPE